jgi:hypothetical protein
VLQGVPKMADKRMETVTAIEEEKTTDKTLAGIKVDGERLRQKERDRKKEKEEGKKKKIADQEGQENEDDQKGGFLGFFRFKNKNLEVLSNTLPLSPSLYSLLCTILFIIKYTCRLKRRPKSCIATKCWLEKKCSQKLSLKKRKEKRDPSS